MRVHGNTTSNPQCTRDMCDNGEHFWLYICSDGWQQGGKGDLTWQFSCIYETITTKILKKIIKFFIDFLELSDKNNF